VESVSHGVIYRRAQCGIDAKPDEETGRRKKQAARKEKGLRLEAGRAPVATTLISLEIDSIVASGSVALRPRCWRERTQRRRHRRRCARRN
jgi:hypothetical protein